MSERGREPGRDQRVVFFLGAALLALVLYYPTPPGFRWVPMTLAITYSVLAGLTALDQWSKRRS
jgi:hypothetical protein